MIASRKYRHAAETPGLSSLASQHVHVGDVVSIPGWPSSAYKVVSVDPAGYALVPSNMPELRPIRVSGLT